MKKILLFILYMIFLVGTVSAVGWDNVLDYEDNDLTVKITNWLGLFGWLGLDDEIGVIELKSHSSINYVKKVGAGNQVVMWYDFNFTELYLNGLGDVEFTDVKTREEIDRDYSFVYWGEKEKNIYETNCYLVGKSTNGSAIEECKRSIVGKEIYNDWLPYDSRDIPKENIRIGLKTYVEVNDKVDGVWTIAGRKVKRHVAWSAALNVDLSYYYAFEEAAGNFESGVDLIVNDLTEQGTVGRVSGKIGNGVEFDNNVANHLESVANVGIVGADPRTTCFWAEQDVPQAEETFLSWGANSNYNRWVVGYDSTVGTKLYISIWADSFKTNVETTTNMDFHCVVFDGTFVNWSINAVNVANVTASNPVNTIDSHLFVGLAIAAVPFDGIIDELGIWNRTLTGAEVVQLYNEGAGMTYTNIFINVSILFPLNITYNETITQLNYSATDIGGNGDRCWNSIDGGATNSTDVVFGTNFTLTFVSGANTWIVYCNNTDFEIAQDSVTFFVNKSVNTELISPLNQSSFNESFLTFLVNSTPINVNLTNVTLNIWYANGTLFGTNFTSLSGSSEVQTNFTRVIPIQGVYFWGAETCGEDINCNVSENRTFEVHLTPATVDIIEPSGTIGSFSIGDNLTLTWNITEPGQNLTAHITNCSYTYNSNEVFLNLTFCTVLNTTSFLYVEGVNTLNFTVLEEFNITTTATTTWDFKVIINNESFSDEIIEGTTGIFILNTTIKGELQLTIANLRYNNTNNFAALSQDNGGNMISTVSKIIPDVVADTNISFFWSLTLDDSTIINTSSNNQTIKNLAIDNCSVFTNVIFNYTIVDEEDQNILSNTTLEVDINIFSLDQSVSILNFSTLYDDVNPSAICLNIALTNDTVYSLDSIVRYESLNHTSEYYNLQSFTLKNSTVPQIINLFSLLSADSTEFQIRFKDSNFVVVENALIQINRQYVSEGLFKTVEIPKTDSNGQTVGHLVEKEVIYNMIIIKEGVILGTFNNIIAFCEDSFIGNCFINLNALVAETVIFDYDNETGIAFSFSYNESSRVLQFPFTTLDGGVKNVSLLATKLDQLGNTTACSESLVTSSGIISCTVPDSIGNETIIVEIFVEGDLKITNYISAGTPFELGDVGYFLMFFLVLSLALMMTQSKIAVILGVVLGFISASLLSFISGGILEIGGSITWLIIMAIILIWKLNSQEQS